LNTFSRIFNSKKALLGLGLSIAMLAGLIGQAAGIMAAGGTTTITATLANMPTSGSQVVNIGDTFTVPVTINTTEHVQGGTVWIQFDQSRLSCSSVTAGAFLTSNGGTVTVAAPSAIDNVAGTAVSDSDALTSAKTTQATGTGTLVTFNFTVKAGAPAGFAAIHVIPNGSGASVTEIDDTNGDAVTNATYVDAAVHVGAWNPTIASISPATAGNGDTVTITGSDLAGATSVAFDTIATTIQSGATNSSITVKITGTGTNTSVYGCQVVTPNGTATKASVLTYKAATVTTMSPAGGSAGITLTVNGTNLFNATAVNFGTTAGTSLNKAADGKSVSVTVPSLSSSGNYAVTVAVPDGTLTVGTQFAYVAGGLASFSPTQAYKGDTVVISGIGPAFTGATAVKFGTIAAQSFTVSTDGSSISAVVPTMTVGATGTISVTVPGTTFTSTQPFTYDGPVTVAISPATSNVTKTGDVVTVNLTINTNGPKQIRGWQSDITFDPTKLQATGVTEGTFLSGFATTNGTPAGSTASAVPFVINNSAGKISSINYFIQGCTDAAGHPLAPTGTGTLATITFVAVTNFSGSSPITPVNTELDDLGGNAINGLTLTPGYVSSVINPIVNNQPVIIDAYLGPQLTFIPPANISGWNLIVSNSNNVQRTMNVFANSSWQVSVADANPTVGYLTKYDNVGGYTLSTHLASPLQVQSDPGNGTGNTINLHAGGIIASGTAAGQNQTNGGDIRGLMFIQPVTYLDQILTSYHMVVTFTASSTGY
jgi:Cohesin domain